MSNATTRELDQPPVSYQPRSLLDLIPRDVIKHLLAGFCERLRSGVAFYCRDPKGKLVRIDIDNSEGNSLLHWSELCAYFRQDSRRDKQCRDCDEQVAMRLLANTPSEPIHYSCTPLGLTDFAASVLVCGHPLAVVIMGQRMPRDERRGQAILDGIIERYPAHSAQFIEAYEVDRNCDTGDRSRSNLYDDSDLPHVKSRLQDFAATVGQIAANVAQLKIQTRQREFRDFWMRKLSDSQPENLTDWQNSLVLCLASLRAFLGEPIERIGLYSGDHTDGRIRYSLVAMDGVQWWPIREFHVMDSDLRQAEHYTPSQLATCLLGPYVSQLVSNRFYSLYPFRQKAAQTFGEIFSVVAIQKSGPMSHEMEDYCQDFLDALCRRDATIRLYLRQRALYERFEQHVTDIGHNLGTSLQHVVNNLELYMEFLNRGIPPRSGSAVEKRDLVKRSIDDHVVRVSELKVPPNTGWEAQLETRTDSCQADDECAIHQSR